MIPLDSTPHPKYTMKIFQRFATIDDSTEKVTMRRFWNDDDDEREALYLHDEERSGRAAKYELRVPSERFKKKERSKCKIALQAKFPGMDASLVESLVGLTEDICLSAYQLARCRNTRDVIVCVLTFCKLRTKHSLWKTVRQFIEDLAHELKVGIALQSAKDAAVNFRMCLDKWQEVKDSDVGMKFSKVMDFMVNYGAMSWMGLEPDEKALAKMKKNHKAWVAADFTYCVVDAISLAVVRGISWYETGDFSNFLHGVKSYQAWVDKVQELKRLSLHLGNIQAQGTTYFKFVNDLNSAIEEGDAIVKYGTDKTVSRYPAAMLNELRMLKANVISRKAAQQDRQAPFAMLVYGKSSIAKSSFMKQMFVFYGKIFGLPTGPEYKFTRDTSKFWSGFTSDKWYLQLDDVGFINPQSGQPDPTLLEMLNIINNVPYVPDQAALEDKGKTPLRARLVLASSNTEDMNAKHYFACPLAVQRRLPWIVNPSPKREYAQDDNPSMMDPSKIPKGTGWLDIWNITVKRVMDGGENGTGQCARIKEYKKFTSIHEFFDWFRDVAIEFQHNQEKAAIYDESLQEAFVCTEHLSTSCGCDAPQGSPLELTELQSDMTAFLVPNTTDVFSLPDGVVWGEDFTCRLETPECQGQWIEFKFGSGWYHFELNGFQRKTKFTRRPYVAGSGRRVVLPEGKEYGMNFEINGIKYDCDRNGNYGYTFGKVRKVARVVYKYEPEEHDVIDYADAMRVAVQAHEESLLQRTLLWLLQQYLTRPWVRTGSNWIFNFSLPRYLALLILSVVKPSAKLASRAVIFTGHMLDIARENRWKTLMAIMLTVVAAGTLYMVISNTTQGNEDEDVVEVIDDAGCTFNRSKKEVSHTEACGLLPAPVEIKLPDGSVHKHTFAKAVSEPALQGNRLPVPASHFKKTERENVWKRDDYEVNSFDIAPAMNNYATLPVDVVASKIRANTLRFTINRGNARCPGHAFCVGGRLWVSNNHIFRMPEDSFDMELFFDTPGKGVSRNMMVKMYQSQLFRLPDKDLVFFELYGCDVKKDLTGLISKPTYTGRHNAMMVSFTRENIPETRSIRDLHRERKEWRELGGTFDVWVGRANTETINGHCGSPYFVHGNVVSIVGLHMFGPQFPGDGPWVGCVPLTTDSVDKAIKFFAKPIIQSGVPDFGYGEHKKILGPLSIRSPLRWIEHGTATVYGSFQGPSAVPRTKCEYTFLGEDIIAERRWDLPYGAPDMKDWRPWHHAYNEIFMQKQLVDPTRLKRVVAEYSTHIISNLKGELYILQKLSVYDAVNGIPGVRFIDKMNFNTSMGEPWNKSKKHFLVDAPTAECPEGKMFVPEVLERISRIDSLYQSGKRACPVFSGQQKDEVRKLSKLINGQIRVFTGAPSDWSVVVRQYLLPFVKMMQENQLVFGAMPGCVAQSIEWENLMKHITKFGEDRMFAGDFRAYDKNLISMLMLHAVEVIIEVYRAAGWTEEELLPLYAYGEDVSFAHVNMNGDLVMFTGSNPSGQPLTVIVNCLVNVLLMMYVYDEAREDAGIERTEENAFWNMVAPATYGDDNAVGVSRNCTWFDHTKFSEGLANIGIVYTMADKSSESVPFIHIDDVSFLKRRWRWDEDIQAHVCPLEEESIHKMLCMHVKGKTLSDESHMCAVMVAAANEWFWYGREVFEREVEWMKTLQKKHDLEAEAMAFPLPTYAELLTRFKRMSATELSERQL